VPEGVIITLISALEAAGDMITTITVGALEIVEVTDRVGLAMAVGAVVAARVGVVLAVETAPAAARVVREETVEEARVER